MTCATDCYGIGGLAGAGPGIGPVRGVEDCYSFCEIILPASGYSDVGGLIGNHHGGIISNAYFLESAGPDNGYGTPLDDPNMMIQANFVGWDFLDESINGENEIWRMCVDGVDYPRLSWEFAQNGDFACGDGVDIFDLQALAKNGLPQRRLPRQPSTTPAMPTAMKRSTWQTLPCWATTGNGISKPRRGDNIVAGGVNPRK